MTVTIERQFKVQLEGRTDWFDLFRTNDDLNNHEAILNDETMESLTEGWDAGVPITDLGAAIVEAKAQFFGKVWTVSNGLVSFKKGSKSPVNHPEEIFSSPIAGLDKQHFHTHDKAADVAIRLGF